MKIKIIFVCFLAGFAEGLPANKLALELEHALELYDVQYAPDTKFCDIPDADGEDPNALFEYGQDPCTEGDWNLNADCPELSCYNNCLLPDLDSRGCLRSCDCMKEGLWGDIMLTESDVAMLESNGGSRAGSKVALKWDLVTKNTASNKKVYVVYYIINPSLTGNKPALKAIEEAIAEYAAKTCILFSPKPDGYKGSYVDFSLGKGCSSFLGRQQFVAQKITIGRFCRRKGNVMHEMMHALGFGHEQSRPDRDDYVTIHWDNIPRAKYRQFRQLLPHQVDSYGSPYDLGSVMHYSGNAFTLNGKPTITEKETGDPVQAQRNGFSEQDILQINAMYQCNKLG